MCFQQYALQSEALQSPHGPRLKARGRVKALGVKDFSPEEVWAVRCLLRWAVPGLSTVGGISYVSGNLAT